MDRARQCRLAQQPASAAARAISGSKLHAVTLIKKDDCPSGGWSEHGADRRADRSTDVEGGRVARLLHLQLAAAPCARSCHADQPIIAMPVAPIGWPFAISPPDVLIAHSPSTAALPSAQNCAPLPGSRLADHLGADRAHDGEAVVQLGDVDVRRRHARHLVSARASRSTRPADEARRGPPPAADRPPAPIQRLARSRFGSSPSRASPSSVATISAAYRR